MWLVGCWSLVLFQPVRDFLPSPVLSIPLSRKSASCRWWHYYGDGLSGLSWSPKGAALPDVHGETFIFQGRSYLHVEVCMFLILICAFILLYKNYFQSIQLILSVYL